MAITGENTENQNMRLVCEELKVGGKLFAPLAADLTALTGSLTGTNDGALADVPVPTDAPADADALREDLTTNVIPAINANFKELLTKVNELVAALNATTS